MHRTSILVLFSLIALSRSAILERNYESEYFIPRSVVYDNNILNANFHSLNQNNYYESYEPGNIGQEVGNEPQKFVDENKSVNPSDEITMFGYHMKIGIPKAIELLRSEGLSSRIIGGSQVASASVIPHQAGIVAQLTTGWQSVCGGSLLSNTKVLTAAHCWWDGVNQANQFTIVLGSVTIFTGGTRIVTSAVTMHANWNAKDITNDLAMATITAVTYNNDIQAIPIPTTAEVNLDFAGMTGTVSGYGRTSDAQTGSTTNLHQVSVNIIMNTVCQSSFQTVTLHGSHLCTSGTGRVGSCDGDSGGPLTTVYNNKRILVGVVSFGLSEGCEFSNPSVYTRVTAFLNWINSNL